MVKTEKELQNEIIEFLKIIGVYCWYQNTVGVYDPTKKAFRRQSKHSMKGVADILGIIQGRMLAVEVKTPTGSISPEQRIFLAQINSNGGIGFIARSVEQCASQLLSHLPSNENLKRFCKEYVAQGSTSDH